MAESLKYILDELLYRSYLLTRLPSIFNYQHQSFVIDIFAVEILNIDFATLMVRLSKETEVENIYYRSFQILRVGYALETWSLMDALR